MQRELGEIRRADRGGTRVNHTLLQQQGVEARRATETLGKIGENKEGLEKYMAKELDMKAKIEEKIEVIEAKTMQVGRTKPFLVRRLLVLSDDTSSRRTIKGVREAVVLHFPIGELETQIHLQYTVRLHSTPSLFHPPALSCCHHDP